MKMLTNMFHVYLPLKLVVTAVVLVVVIVVALVVVKLGAGEPGLKSDFKLSRSYHRPQVGFGDVCKCMQVSVW